MSTGVVPMRWPMTAIAVSLGLVAAACGQTGSHLTSPSSISNAEAKPSSGDATAVSFLNFDPSTLTVTIRTTTTSSLGLSYIDQGKIHLEILVDATGQPLPCGSVGTWVRFDGQGGGIGVSGAITNHDVDLDDLESRGVGVKNVHCGDSICIRAHYITGGGQTKVETHFSNPTRFDVVCALTCTYTQGYWKNHGPIPSGNNSNVWPVTSLMLGSVNYTDLQLLSILDQPVGGNGLISLAHQLIAAKLNLARGADGSAVAAAIAAADALIGGLIVPPVGAGFLLPSDTGALNQILTDYNEGIIGPGHCSDGN